MLETTGQLFFRETDKEHDGKKIMMVVGLVAFKTPPPGEHQLTVIGRDNGMVLVEGSEIDLTETARGQDLGGMVMLPIWRC